MFPPSTTTCRRGDGEKGLAVGIALLLDELGERSLDEDWRGECLFPVEVLHFHVRLVKGDH